MAVYAGGIIFIKSDYNTLNMTNVITRTFFLNYYAYNNALNNYTNVKAYESYSNSVWARGASIINVTKSNFERAGGPLFILCDQTSDDDHIPQYGKVIVDAESKLESLVVGQETWFVSNSATAYASQIMALDNLFREFDPVFQNYQLPSKTIIKDNKLNIICATIRDGAIMTGVSSGYFKYGNVELDRRLDSSAYAQTLVQALIATVQGTTSGYALNIGAATTTSMLLQPVPVELSPMGIAPFDFAGNLIDPETVNPLDLAWLLAAAEPAICLNMPTIGVMIGFYNN